MYTADMARLNASTSPNVLDERIEAAVIEANYIGAKQASIRIYIDDPFKDDIREELKKRGFTVLYVPDICLKGDVDFSW
jgi:hypothetical protein